MISVHVRNLIDRYYLGIAREEEVAELDATLLADSDARESFIAAARLETNLYDEAVDSVDMSEPQTHAPIRTRVVSLAAICATVAACLALLMLYVSRGPSPVATLVSNEDAAWESSLPTTPGSELVPGRLHLKAGVATILFRSGAELVLEAPAQLELETSMRCKLLEGSAVIDVPESAIGFVVATPDGYAVDHGTSFTVSAGDAHRESLFEVLDGEISVHLPSGGRSLRLRKDEGATVGTEGIVKSVFPLSEGTLTPTDTTIKVGTEGRATSISPNPDADLHPDFLMAKLPIPKSPYERRSLMAFDMREVDLPEVTRARLRLNLVPVGLGRAAHLPKINRFAVYGLTDEMAENWAIDCDWGDVPGLESATLLGTFEVPRSLQRGTFEIATEPLLDFLKAEADGAVTLVLVRETQELKTGGLVHAFASDSHPEAAGPTLELVMGTR